MATIHGVHVRPNYPDYPKNLKDWEFWQVCENHTIGTRIALRSCGCMDDKFHIRRWHKEAREVMKKHGHSTLDVKQCSCYSDWTKVTGKRENSFH